MTKFAEEGASEQPVHVFSVDPVNQLAIQGAGDGSYIAIMSVDRQESSARTEFDECLRIIESSLDGNNRLFRMHTDAWAKVWEEGSVEMEGDTQIAKITTFSQYYLLASLPTITANQPPPHQEFVYGISRGSLAKGRKGNDYQGHIMWDSEVRK
jgi:trehalose/maltose hydrolase-like predicted phosphorylase